MCSPVHTHKHSHTHERTCARMHTHIVQKTKRSPETVVEIKTCLNDEDYDTGNKTNGGYHHCPDNGDDDDDDTDDNTNDHGKHNEI